MIAFTVFEILHLETIQQLIQDFPYYRKELFEFHITKIELDRVEKSEFLFRVKSAMYSMYWKLLNKNLASHMAGSKYPSNYNSNSLIDKNLPLNHI